MARFFLIFFSKSVREGPAAHFKLLNAPINILSFKFLFIYQKLEKNLTCGIPVIFFFFFFYVHQILLNDAVKIMCSKVISDHDFVSDSPAKFGFLAVFGLKWLFSQR